MRFNVSVAVAERPAPLRLMVEAEPVATVAELTERIGELGHGTGYGSGAPDPRYGSGAPDRSLYVRGRPVDPAATLAAAGVEDGGELGLGRPTPAPATPAGTVELRLVGGPGAGLAYQLTPGQYQIGSAPTARVRLDPPAPPVAMNLLVRADHRVFLLDRPADGADETPTDGDGDGADNDVEWPEGAQLAVGANLLEMVAEIPTRAPLSRSTEDLTWEFNRPPRFVPAAEGGRFQLPTEPRRPDRNPIPLATLLLTPVGAALAGILITGRWSFVFLAFLSPVAALLTLLGSRKRNRVSFAEQMREYQEKLARVRADADAAVLQEQRQRRYGYPDPATLARIAVQPTDRLWERRRHDPDFLDLRVGTASVPSAVQVLDPALDEHRRTTLPLLDDVPVPVSLRTFGVVGLAGPAAARQASWLTIQAAVLHSPRDLRICVLTDRSAEERWGWLRWLPHVKPDGGTGYLFIGTTAESVSVRVVELIREVTARVAAAESRRADPDQPEILVVLDGARRLRSLPGVIQLLREGPAVGVRVLCVEPEERLLPEECQAVVHTAGTAVTVRSGSGPQLTDIRADEPRPGWYEPVARGTAALRATGDAEDAVLPASARLLDVLALEPPTPPEIAARWLLRPRSTTAVLGIGLDGEFAVDLVRDGPHALIAGTTGAGKSELLQTLVATLAVANRPDEMTFVLLDYKGGSAFAECAELPHTVGMVTDLDTHLVERALTSLGAELRRREHLLAARGAADIVAYHEKRARDPMMPALPRLVLVIDEFASMVRELPDFVAGLVNIAQRGRSLGIHLVLATQRPSGAVTPDIRANTNLRIALRTTDPAESRDIIDAPDAGELSPRTPGRAFARLGFAALLPFQAGRIGGKRPAAGGAAQRGSVHAVEVPFFELGDPPAGPARPVGAAGGPEVETDLRVLVRAISAAARDAGIPAQPSPWLPPLADTVRLAELPALPGPTRPGDLGPVGYGVVDLPASQSREPLVFDVDRAGHLYVIGSSRSGRSQTLRTLAAALAGAHRAADLHLYGIDCGNGALLPLTGLRHTGAVVDRLQTERLDRMLDWLGGELTRRQGLLGEHGAADLAELRGGLPADRRPPHLVVLLDRFEVYEREFATFDNGRYLDRLIRVLRDGAAAGIHLVLAGDKTLGAGRYGSATEDKLVLRLNDRADYSMVGLGRKAVPPDQQPGRAVRVADAAEAQVAVLAADLSGAGQAGAIGALAADLAARDADLPPGQSPKQFGVLPEQLTFEEAVALRTPGRPALWALVGVGGDDLAGVGPDLGDNPTFLIGGPPRSGRSTALLTVARSLLDGGTGLLVLAPRRSPLRELAGCPGVVGVVADAAIRRGAFADLLGSITEKTGAVLIDDAELMVQSEIDNELLMLARGAAGDGWGLVIAGNAEGLTLSLANWLTQAKRNRAGMLLSPQSVTDGEVIGVRLPRGIVGRPPQPGRGYLHLGDGSLSAVQVPRTV
ncbi:FtsK/SpoIIIE domain-containing protein [Micromonospora sp. NBC_01813]|uniref:FtsK/SpoIIIE domain-containing protein n=1 Tax=Micromonospora sp. NBC_01813 TaxID=2975988 RepID=UPI002DD8F0B0|nr:FtsK/SpoIIIE domain-containing protein [Micromonospora sp. NBC_01813]WSA07523.1 FtsK/SpoIIIE domain-containing protein [Micromonospora sp. NBC_01813]